MDWPVDPARAGVFADFDGTLSPIVLEPASARPFPGAAETLSSLATRFAVVAVVSGRPAAFLASVLGVDASVSLYGAYGLEKASGSGVEVDPAVAPWVRAVAEAVKAARLAAPPGVEVEDKGISLTLHYRGAPSAASWVSDWAASCASSAGLVVHDGRKSVELRPPVAVDKGIVVTRLVASHGLDAACTIGDDLGDLPAFRALDDVASPLRVAVRSDESPPALLELADVIVEGPAGALAFLQSLGG